jgi:hypothetical protein
MAPLAWFLEGFGKVVDDIRHKVVEEPWFGREVTPSSEPPQPSLAEALGWAQGPIDPSPTPDSRADQEHGLDR